MQRNNQIHIPQTDLFQRMAFHEAGHAAAIFLRNKAKRLPPVYFHIAIYNTGNTEKPINAKVEGGRLIENLPIAALEYRDALTEQLRVDYRAAYQADVVNLLAGPLAEMKYRNLRNFPDNNIGPDALRHYGGKSDIEEAFTYLKYFIPGPERRQQIFSELLEQAIQFVNESINWIQIIGLAYYILDSRKTTISCEEASEVFEALSW